MTKDRAVAKIIDRIEEEMADVEMIRREADKPMTAATFDELCSAADCVKEWANNLTEFTARASEDELTPDDFEKFVPTGE